MTVPALDCSCDTTWPLKTTVRLGSAAMIRLSTAKSELLGPLVNVATWPAGRKSIGPLPTLSLGVQLRMALGVVTVMVSVVGLVRLRVALPAATAGEP